MSRLQYNQEGGNLIPSKKGYLILVLSIVIAPIISIFLGVAQSLSIVWFIDVLILVLLGFDSKQGRKHRVNISRTLPPRLSIGRDNPVILRVESGKAAAFIQIRDDYPREFKVSQDTIYSFIAAQSSQELTYTVHPTGRGKFSWGNMQVRQLGPWGLAWDNWQIPQKMTSPVYPDLVALRSLSIRLTLQFSGSNRKMHQLGIGTEFSELRNYHSGDDLRLVDWKATARRVGTFSNSTPLVRVLTPEHEQTLIILLDRGRLMTARVKGLQRFDWGLNTTLALALTALHRGDRVGIGVFDRQMHTWIAPARGLNHLHQLIDRLTPLQPELLESDYANSITYLVQQQARRALVVIITDLVDITASAELLTALAKLVPRYLPFCVTLRDPLVDELAYSCTTDIPKSYLRAVALDLLAQRQVAFAQLKQKGVLVLDAPANQVSDQLVAQYLQIKSRNQL